MLLHDNMSSVTQLLEAELGLVTKKRLLILTAVPIILLIESTVK